MSKLVSHHQSEVAQNREYLSKIIEAILFCAKLGLAFRGHDESSESNNRGNFLEALYFKHKENDVFMRVLDSSTVKYTSKDIQNELIEILASNIRTRIIREVKQAQQYSVILDETMDISRHEQLSCCL